MTDASSTPAVPVTIYRGDYRPPEWQIPDIALDFALGINATKVGAALSVVRQAEAPVPLLLRGDGLTPAAVRVDGEVWNDWRIDGSDLIVDLGERTAAIVEIDTVIDPAANTQLSGLYASGGLLCTQCEAEGFRRITFFPDRPDVLAATASPSRPTARPARCCSPTATRHRQGELPEGRHWAKWEDPCTRSPPTCSRSSPAIWSRNGTASRRCPAARSRSAIYVRQRRRGSYCGHAMTGLKASMAWDEDVYGLEYDLDVFNIAAVSDFNMGAMENKGLNVFNTKYILARPDTATDADYEGIETVVAHEYFHNWTGNRVTCRDWFQLSAERRPHRLPRPAAFRPSSWARRGQADEPMSACSAPRNSPRMPGRSRTRCAPTAIRKSRTSTPRPSITRAPRSSG
jgi:aminopeptidase N